MKRIASTRGWRGSDRSVSVRRGGGRRSVGREAAGRFLIAERRPSLTARQRFSTRAVPKEIRGRLSCARETAQVPVHPRTRRAALSDPPTRSLKTYVSRGRPAPRPSVSSSRLSPGTPFYLVRVLPGGHPDNLATADRCAMTRWPAGPARTVARPAKRDGRVLVRPFRAKFRGATGMPRVGSSLDPGRAAWAASPFGGQNRRKHGLTLVHHESPLGLYLRRASSD